jgi:hypothetical protein
VFENALCRTNKLRRCGKIVVESLEEAAEKLAKAEAERIAARDIALEEVKVGAEEVARRAAERGIKNSTVTLEELLGVTVAGIKGGFKTVVKWFERRVRPPL